jgi:chloramphenicol-sensitive protein RarD
MKYYILGKIKVYTLKVSINMNKKNRTGIFYGISAYVIWGLLPLYWKKLNAVSAIEILSHRIVWALLFMVILVIATKRMSKVITLFKDLKRVIYMVMCAITICINWGVYIWAVTSGHMVDASMGYYINPLVSVILAVLVLKEKLDFWQKISILLAAVGVSYLVIKNGNFPWVALILAFSFGAYGLFKKLLSVDSITGLTLETAILAPFFLSYIIWRQASGIGAYLSISWQVTALLTFAGIVTAVPLLLFAKGANRTDLTTLGFTQYFSPSIMLLIGVIIYGEHFDLNHLIAFICVWAGLIIYSVTRLNWSKSIKI